MAVKKTRPKNARRKVSAAALATPEELAEEGRDAVQAAPERPSALSAVPRHIKPRKAAEPTPEPEPAPRADSKAPEASEAQEPGAQEKAEEPARESEAAPEKPWGASEEAPPAAALPPAGRGETGNLMKGFAILALLCTAVFLAYYFISLPENSFVTGSKVDAETFKGIFLDSGSVYIVMDVRGAGSDAVSNNILQCGVDFAASSGMGGKIVTPLSFGPEGCVAPDGMHPAKECFAMLKNGITVYVKEGPGETAYYSNGMVVPVGTDYDYGTCGIKRT